MSKVKKRNLLEALGDAHIDIAYGVHDRPGPQISTEQLPDFKPVTPKGQVALQLSADKPPVDDSDYVPTPGRDLKLALAALAEKIPEESIEDFYKRVRRMVGEMSSEYLDEVKILNKERKKMKNLRRNDSRISEAPILRRKGSMGLPRMKPGYVDPADVAADREEEKLKKTRAASGKEEIDWDVIAKATGYSGPSGPKGSELRSYPKLRQRLMVRNADMREVIDAAYDVYVNGIVKIYENNPETDDESLAQIINDLEAARSETVRMPNKSPLFQHMLSADLLDPTFDELVLDYKSLKRSTSLADLNSPEFESFVIQNFPKKAQELLPKFEQKYERIFLSAGKDPVVASSLGV